MVDLVEKISVGIDGWLREEIVNSRDGRNSFLDEYLEFADDYRQVDDSRHSVDAMKAQSHHNRFRLLMELRKDPTTADKLQFLGKIMHHSLMFVSGGYRTECFFRATHSADYSMLRFGYSGEPGRGTSADIANVVGATLDSFEPSCVIDRSLDINDEIFSAHHQARRWFASSEKGLGQLSEDDIPVQLARRRQVLGLELAVSHAALVSASYDGDFGRVPVLEPKSISDVSNTPLYPFA